MSCRALHFTVGDQARQVASSPTQKVSRNPSPQLVPTLQPLLPSTPPLPPSLTLPSFCLHFFDRRDCVWSHVRPHVRPISQGTGRGGRRKTRLLRRCCFGRPDFKASPRRAMPVATFAHANLNNRDQDGPTSLRSRIVSELIRLHASYSIISFHGGYHMARSDSDHTLSFNRQYSPLHN
jgi:hypothetical protein